MQVWRKDAGVCYVHILVYRVEDEATWWIIEKNDLTLL